MQCIKIQHTVICAVNELFCSNMVFCCGLCTLSGYGYEYLGATRSTSKVLSVGNAQSCLKVTFKPI